MALDSCLTPSSLKSATIVLSSCSAIVPDLRRAVSFALSKRSGRSSRNRTTQTRETVVRLYLKYCRSCHSRRLAALFLTAISSRSADLAHKVHWTLCLKPNHALKELEILLISSSVKAHESMWRAAKDHTPHAIS